MDDSFSCGRLINMCQVAITVGKSSYALNNEAVLSRNDAAFEADERLGVGWAYQIGSADEVAGTQQRGWRGLELSMAGGPPNSSPCAGSPSRHPPHRPSPLLTPGEVHALDPHRVETVPCAARNRLDLRPPGLRSP